MNPDLLPFLGFALVASATPGPNNIMALATGAAHGLRATLPLILGVALGFAFMVAAVGIGLAQPLAAHPLWHEVLRWVGAGWLLLLAWKIARAPGQAEPGVTTAARPIGFWGACGLQWVNPKAWIMALATAATYTRPGHPLAPQVLILAGIFLLIGLGTVTSWAMLGAHARRYIAAPGRLRIFNTAMGLLLAASVIPAVFE
ncbi:LysE family translocator [Acidisoma sp. C75]